MKKDEDQFGDPPVPSGGEDAAVTGDPPVPGGTATNLPDDEDAALAGDPPVPGGSSA